MLELYFYQELKPLPHFVVREQRANRRPITVHDETMVELALNAVVAFFKHLFLIVVGCMFIFFPQCFRLRAVGHERASKTRYRIYNNAFDAM